jgi:hypothetical protein
VRDGAVGRVQKGGNALLNVHIAQGNPASPGCKLRRALLAKPSATWRRLVWQAIYVAHVSTLEAVHASLLAALRPRLVALDARRRQLLCGQGLKGLFHVRSHVENIAMLGRVALRRHQSESGQILAKEFWIHCQLAGLAHAFGK